MSASISHIGVVVRDLDASVRFWTEVVGLVEVHRAKVEAEGVRTAMLAAAAGAAGTLVELIEPIDKMDTANPIARRLQREGEGFYHLAIIDGDAPGKAGLLASRGVTVVERPPAELGASLVGRVGVEANRYIVHPKSANGVLVELLQRAR